MRKLLFYLGSVLFIWPMVSLLSGVFVKNSEKMANLLSLGFYDLLAKIFPELAFLTFISLAVIGFVLMVLFSGENKHIK